MSNTFARHLLGAYLEMLTRALNGLDVSAVLRIYERLEQARRAGRTIYLAGNGGSAATASHWANDLGKAARRDGAPPMRVVSLADHVAWVTALANDEGYARVFAGQLENLVAPGDVLVVFSASGNSPNLVEAVRTARALGGESVAMLGFDGGVLKSMVDDCIWVPTPPGAYGPVEDAHLVACHLITACLSGSAVTAGLAGIAGHPAALPALGG